MIAAVLNKPCTLGDKYVGSNSQEPAMNDSETLHRLAQAVRRLSPSHRDPHRFHEDKSEIERELRRLARKAERTNHD